MSWKSFFCRTKLEPRYFSLATNPVVKEKYLGSNFVLQKKDFQLIDERKRQQEAEQA